MEKLPHMPGAFLCLIQLFVGKCGASRSQQSLSNDVGAIYIRYPVAHRNVRVLK